MEQNQKNDMDRNENSNERMGQQDDMRNQQGNESLNTASGLREQAGQQSDDAGSGRSYDYGSENSTEEDTNQQLGRNSNQQNVSNPVNTPGTDSDATTGAGRNESRAGTGSGLTTKQNITGSDFDGQNRV